MRSKLVQSVAVARESARRARRQSHTRRSTPRRVVTVALVAGAMAVAGCGAAKAGDDAASRPRAPTTTTMTPTTTTTTTTPVTTPTTTSARPLQGEVVTIDPGHNGDNFTDPAFIDVSIWNGREHESCDTTGTETDGGYTEAQFNFDVAQDAAADLRSEGATVVMTRTTNAGVGPCVTQRAAIGNDGTFERGDLNPCRRWSRRRSGVRRARARGRRRQRRRRGAVASTRRRRTQPRSGRRRRCR